MVLDEQGPVSSPGWNRPPKVSEVPGQNWCATCFGHGHHYRVRQIEPGGLVALEQLERAQVLGVSRSVENVGTISNRVPEDDCRSCVPSSPQDEVHLHVDGPRDDHPPAEPREKTDGELVPVPLPAIAGRDERPCVADDQSTSRDSTSSTRRERSGSSAIAPAYGSSPGVRPTSSATSAEKDVPRRLASRSSRFARDAGIEIVRRTALMVAV